MTTAIFYKTKDGNNSDVYEDNHSKITVGKNAEKKIGKKCAFSHQNRHIIAWNL